MASSAERPLTPRQAAVFEVVQHYHAALDEPVPASYVARKLEITKQRVQAIFQTLNALGWLRSAGSPAIPVRARRRAGGLTKRQLPQDRTAGHASNVPPVQPRVVEVPPLSFRAVVTPGSANDDLRTIDLVFTTGAPVERMDWWTGKRYIETLSLDPAHVRLHRLNEGGPLLDSHSDYSVTDILGSVVPGSVSLTKKEGRARVSFSKREAVEPIWQDVKDGHIRSVSVGYRIYKYEETVGKGNELPVRMAVDWEPFEVSMVPIPADAGAKTRGEKPADTNPCEIVTRGASEEIRMEREQSETIVQPNPLAPPPPPPPAAEPTEVETAIRAERERNEGILLACRAARLPQAFADKLIKDGTKLVDAQGQVLRELARRGGDDRGPKEGPPEVRVGDDPLVHVRAGIENAILHRVHPAWVDAKGNKGGFELTEQGREYRGMSMLRIAEAYLMARGIRTTRLTKIEMAGQALGLSERGGMHSSSDFALLLADVATKTLRAAYGEAPQTFSLISRRVTLPDFKVANRVQIGDSPALLEVKEHGEFQRGTVTEGKEVLQLKTYGRVFAITRQALVNDDTDAFSRMAMGFGRQARALESDLAWQQITTNPVMGDGVTLFHATHGNLAGSGTAIDVTSIGAARAAMRVQKGIDTVTFLNINPRYLYVPAAKETIAQQFLTPITPATPSTGNPFVGALTAVAEPRLDVNSPTAWYLVASPGDGVDVLEIATLEGEGGPMTENRVGFDIDGLEIKARTDVAVKIIDWRGIYKNPGA